MGGYAWVFPFREARALGDLTLQPSHPYPSPFVQENSNITPEPILGEQVTGMDQHS